MTVQRMDYGPLKIDIDVTNEVEQTYRLGACQKEPWTVEFIERIPSGGTFWDIGACVGSYSLIAVARGLRTVAVEPFFANYSSLCRNLALNNALARCITICGAVGAVTGWEWLHLQDMRSGAASHVLGGGKKLFFHQHLVPVYSLDDLFCVVPEPPEPGPAYLKIDVDGGEANVLAGGAAVLARPDLAGIMLEMQLEQEPELVKALAGHGWKVAARYDHRDGQEIAGVAYARFERA